METSDSSPRNKAACTVRHPKVSLLRELLRALCGFTPGGAAAVNSPHLVAGLGCCTLRSLSSAEEQNITPLSGE